MSKDQKKRQKQLQKKVAKRKLKKDQFKKVEQTKVQKSSESIFDKVDFALEIAQDGDFLEASKIVNKLKRKYPNNPDVQFGLGVLAMHSENYEGALEHFEKTVDIDPTHIFAHFNQAVAYQKQTNIKGMVESFENVIRLRDKDPEIADKAQEQLESLSEAISRDDGITLNQFVEAQTTFEKGFEHMEKQEYEDAIPQFKKAMVINPNPPQTYGNLGLCYAYLGEKEQALRYLDEALELDPKYEPALLNRDIIEKLKPGEKYKIPNMKTINYYKDFRE
jgi:tetratricopeptide (TPR) repeat protein